MSIDRKYWISFYFRKGEIPEIICPTCKEGKLVRNKDFISFETKKSIDLRDLYFTNEMNYEENFVGFLKCNNKNCLDNVSVIGTAFLESDESDYDGSLESKRPSFCIYYRPEYFIPPLEIFRLKKEYPLAINNALRDSFKLFFSDTESSANKIRIVIEILLDILKVPKTFMNSRNKREKYKLHKRIELYKNTNTEIVELLLSVKWIGNYGRHKENLKRDDLIDAYTFLQMVLDKLYDDNSKKILNLAKTINKTKKTASKSKRK